MKILVVDDEPVARRILSGVLAKTSYEVLVFEDGEGALRAALELKEPYVAIIDWVMPGMSGVQVCAGLRSARNKFRPYVIMLSAKSGKTDVAEALDNGADDYLSKPFSPGELIARLRAAERMLQFQAELQKNIDQLETLAQRYNLLGEIVSRPTSSAPVAPTTAAPAAAALTPSPSSATTQVAAELKPAIATPPAPRFTGPDLDEFEMDAGVLPALAGLKLGTALSRGDAPRRDRVGDYIAWVGVILPERQVQLDLLLQLDTPAAHALFLRILRRKPATEGELLRFLAETHTLVSSGFRSALQAKNIEAMTPILSTAVGSARDFPLTIPAEHTVNRLYELAGHFVTLTVVRSESPVHNQVSKQLRPGDILAEAFPPPEVNEIPLLNRGIVLTERFIEKLTTVGDGEIGNLFVPVFRNTKIGTSFANSAR